MPEEMDDIDAFFANLEGQSEQTSQRRANEREQLARLMACPEATPVFALILQRMGVASALGASEAEAAMRNFGLRLLADIGEASPNARQEIVKALFCF